MTGDRTAHPLLISLANMKGSYRAKSSHHAFLLLALLPVPKFVTRDKPLCGVLENRCHAGLSVAVLSSKILGAELLLARCQWIRMSLV